MSQNETTIDQNYFAELAKINVNEHVEKKGKFSYLSWPYAVDVLRKRHPTATWEVKRFGPEALPYLKTELGYFVEVPVTVNGITLSQLHPVLDNNNRPIKTPDPFQINTSLQRALVKSIALHGLGLYIYAGEDLPDDDSTPAAAPAPSAREKALAAAKEKQNQSRNSTQASNQATTPAADDVPWEVSEEDASTPDTDTGNAVGGEVIEPINEGQLKAIASMLTLVSKKKEGFSGANFIKDAVTKFGKSKLEELSFDQGKEIVVMINAELRKK